jgi:polyisoprenoid-binding protein YceI
MLNVRTLAIAASAAIVVSSCGSNESAEAVVASAPVNHTVDAAASTMTWTGTKVGGAHTGTIAITEGSFVMSGDTVTGGTITIDMLTIKNTDLRPTLHK